jgi:ribosome-binding protein aMBF1 (putative translation factor)
MTECDICKREIPDNRWKQGINREGEILRICPYCKYQYVVGEEND